MDPITIVTSVITMGQAIGRLRVLVSGIKAYFDAPEEFENLMNEVTDLKQVMSKLQSTAADLPLQESDILTKKVDSYSTILSKIDDLVCKVLPSSAAEEESRRRQVNRVTWVRKRNKIERLMEKLTRANLPLLLHINSLQLYVFPVYPKSIQSFPTKSFLNTLIEEHFAPIDHQWWPPMKLMVLLAHAWRLDTI